MATCPICNKEYPFSEIEFHVEICLSEANEPDKTKPQSLRASNPQLRTKKWIDLDPYQLDIDESLDPEYQSLMKNIENIYGHKEVYDPKVVTKIADQIHEPSQDVVKPEPGPVSVSIPDAIEQPHDNASESHYELELRGFFLREILNLLPENTRAAKTNHIILHMKDAWNCFENSNPWNSNEMPAIVTEIIQRYVQMRSDYQGAMERLKTVQLTHKNIGIFNVLPQEILWILLSQSSAYTLTRLCQCSKDFLESTESDLLWRELFAKDFKSSNKLNEDLNWKENYRQGFAFAMDGEAIVRTDRWIYSHASKTLIRHSMGSMPQRYYFQNDRITGGVGTYFWIRNTLRVIGSSQGSYMMFNPDSKSFQGFMGNSFSHFATRVIKEFPLEWHISAFKHRLISITIKGNMPIPLIAFICYAQTLEA